MWAERISCPISVRWKEGQTSASSVERARRALNQPGCQGGVRAEGLPSYEVAVTSPAVCSLAFPRQVTLPLSSLFQELRLWR